RWPSTRSLALAENGTAAPAALVASATMGAGTVSAGGVVSTTVRLNEPDPRLPWASLDEQCTAVVPSGKVLPDAGSHETTVAPSTRSFALARKLTLAPVGPVASRESAAGRFSVGGVVSRTMTSKLAWPTLPCASVAEQLTCVVPRAKLAPLCAVQLGGTSPSTRSCADVVKLTVAPAGPLASTTTSAG